jgi:hypothetical protein
MQRLLNNLVVLIVAGLISTSGSIAFAHGGGGNGGSHASTSHSSAVSRLQSSVPHYNKIKDAGHGRVVSDKGDYRGPRHPVPKHPVPRGPGRHRWPCYHMCYPVGFWFGGELDDDSSDAAPDGIDVEFTSIRRLDNGDPAKNLAPAYRVWFHNNSSVDIDQPFDVAILASTDGQLTKDLPFAAMRVDGLAADETSSVDIRLPIAAMKMVAGNQTAEYSFVHAIIDSQRELDEANKANNVAVFNRNDIPLLDAPPATSQNESDGN